MNTNEQGREMSILLVEDHPFQLIGMEMQLNRKGFFRLTPAMDRAEAIALINEGRRFDLLLCDQHLPDGLGTHLIEEAYALGGIRYAILISGIDEAHLRQSTLETAHERGLPILANLSKPLSMEAFLEALPPIWENA
jgi:CheY-like chemotaxis protein